MAPVNEMAMQNIWRYHFLQPGQGLRWDILTYRGCGKAALYEFDYNCFAVKEKRSPQSQIICIHLVNRVLQFGGLDEG